MNGQIIAIGAPQGVPSAVCAVPRSTASVVDVVSSAPGDVLLVARDAQGRQIARAARLAMGAERIGILHMPMPYTAWIAAIEILGAMGPGVELSRAAEIACALAGSLHTRAVLSSVAALDKPAPTLAQHLRGMFCGARFLVDLAAGTVTGFAGTLSADSCLVVVARSAKPVAAGLDRGWPEGRLEVGAVEAGWKARRWLEVTTLDEQQWCAASAQLSQPADRVSRCPACDRSGSLMTCLFCDIPLVEGASAAFGAVPIEGACE